MEPPLKAGALNPDRVAALLAGLDDRIKHLYLHLPFCERICPYCDFSTAVGAGADIQGFVGSLEKEADLLGRSGVLSFLEPRDGTLYLGGGTPSWFEPDVLAHLLLWINTVCGRGWIETTLEMNPEHADQERLRVLRKGGINRISLGVQSLDRGVLRRLGRVHTPDEVLDAVAGARAVGFAISIDLIFAVPGQDRQGWCSDVEGVLALEPDHISIYSLTYEPGTPFTRWLGSGRIEALDDDWQAEAYRWAAESLRSEGYERYEVGNFARPGRASIHNQAYWDGSSYLGMGPSAHSLLGPVRTANHFGLRQWSAALMEENRVPWEIIEALDDLDVARERVLLGLRTSKGLDLESLPSQYRQKVAERAGELVREGLAGWRDDSTLVLTDRGILLADLVAVRVAP